MEQHVNIVGPQVRRLRSGKGWSQNDLAIRLQLLGMDNATRCKISKIEARLVWVSDDDLIFLARALAVSTEQLYPDYILGAKRLYDAICTSKASRFGAFIFGLIGCSQLGAGAFHFPLNLACV